MAIELPHGVVIDDLESLESFMRGTRVLWQADVNAVLSQANPRSWIGVSGPHRIGKSESFMLLLASEAERRGYQVIVKTQSSLTRYNPDDPLGLRPESFILDDQHTSLCIIEEADDVIEFLNPLLRFCRRKQVIVAPIFTGRTKTERAAGAKVWRVECARERIAFHHARLRRQHLPEVLVRHFLRARGASEELVDFMSRYRALRTVPIFASLVFDGVITDQVDVRGNLQSLRDAIGRGDSFHSVLNQWILMRRCGGSLIDVINLFRGLGWDDASSVRSILRDPDYQLD